jgi:hypothetical protein
MYGRRKCYYVNVMYFFDPLAIEHDEWLIKILHDLWVDRWISESLEDCYGRFENAFKSRLGTSELPRAT